MLFKKLLKKVVKIVVIIIGIVVVYLIFSYTVPLIPVQAEATPAPKMIRAYLYTNGVHTDFVLPIESKYIDWSEKFPFENTISKRTDYKYISIGWGDKGFYLDTPTWADLKFSTAVEAAFWLGEAAVHATYLHDVEQGEDTKTFMMTERQYQNLIAFIDKSLDKDKNGNYILVQTDSQYGKDDAFYEAKGRYSFLHTCNTWTNNGLKEAGQKAALWTPTDKGIFWHYE